MNRALKRAMYSFALLSLISTTLVFNIEFRGAVAMGFTGVIRITADGAVEGTDKITQNGTTYTLTDDITGGVGDEAVLISIERDGIVIDGGEKTIKGTNSGTAIGVYGRSDVTIKNLRIVDFGTGIEVYTYNSGFNSTAMNNQIIDNYFETSYWAIDLRGEKGLVSGNTFVSKNSNYGVVFWANETYFTNNAFTNGGLVFNDPGVLNVFSGNTINGKPLLVLENQSNQVIDGANQVVLINCRDMDIQNIPEIGLRQPIVLYDTTGTRIADCTVRNVLLTDSQVT